MNQLKVLGHEHVGHIEFTGIEGGFGENKKAMTVKDIAVIHHQPLGEVNRRISDNRKRFKDGIDIIDLLNGSEPFRKFAETNGLIGSNRTEHVYLLSERGYSKLLKILEDDKAWEVYDQLVDNYFTQRQALRDNQPELVANKRLEIMAENAKTRRGNLLMKIAMATTSESSRETLLADAAEAVTGSRHIPIMKKKEYSATQVAKMLGLTSAKRVGMLAEALKLKAAQPGQNDFGRWAADKSQHGPKEVATWLYFTKGVEAIKVAAQNRGLI